MNRRQWIQACCAAVAELSTSATGSSAETQPRTTTFTYKTVGPLEIRADLIRPDDQTLRPLVVWIHGGALIMGNREGISRRVQQMLLEAGYAIVSIDYRLAPETKLPLIIEDLEDAFRWLRTQGAKQMRVDPRKMAVMGGSAGGYLTLTSGFHVQPPPTVLVSFWGYGDLIGPWYSQPSPHPRHHRVKLTEKEAFQQVSGPPIASSTDRRGDGGAFYQYCRQHGLWPKAVSGWDPHTQASNFFAYMPVRNVTRDYPPTLLIHGTEDTDVPYEQSVLMADELKRHGVEHRLVTVPGAEHGLAGGDPKLVDSAYRVALEFVNRHMR